MVVNDAEKPVSYIKSSVLSFAIGLPISCLGGLIGLGGAEFRLPFLLKTFNKTAKKAVALNMPISLITVISAICFRTQNVNAPVIIDQMFLIAAMVTGSITGAYWGIGVLNRVSDVLFKKIMLILLLSLGLLLIIESFVHFNSAGIVFGSLYLKLIAAVFCGFIIGAVSSLLGVAGGEIIIPVLILIFGIDIKSAGTMSLIISVPTMLVGIGRHRKNRMYADKTEIKYLVVPMGTASIIGASIGALLVVYAPSEFLKLILGILLLITSVKLFAEKHHPAKPNG